MAYSGKAYCGWQYQPNAPTVQETIDKALRILTKNTALTTTGCGRTDTGVHASSYYLHFDSVAEILEHDKFLYKLNALLPLDISINELIPVCADAHTRFDAQKRAYTYYIHFKKNPFCQDFSVFQKNQPDVILMNKAGEILLGKHDFTSFAKLHSDNSNNLCEVFEAKWLVTEQGIEFHIAANRFLRNMVRAIVGTMLALGNGKITLKQFEEIFISKERALAGTSAPAHGLFLSQIDYPYISKKNV